MTVAHERHYCRICDTAEMVEEARALVREYVASLPPEACVDDDTYARRLTRCDTCPHLSGGDTCTLCGCLLPVRARLRAKGCPDPDRDQWAAV